MQENVRPESMERITTEALANAFIDEQLEALKAQIGDKKVLLALVRKMQLPALKKAIKSVDPKAFLSVSPASDVFGEGFDEIKTGLHRKK